MELGAWIRNQRRAKRWSETECARRAGVPLQQWNRWEKRVKRPQQESCETIARGLRLPVDKVLLAAGYYVSAQATQSTLSRRLDRVLQELPKAQREKVEEELVKDAEQYVGLLLPNRKKDNRTDDEDILSFDTT